MKKHTDDENIELIKESIRILTLNAKAFAFAKTILSIADAGTVSLTFRSGTLGDGSYGLTIILGVCKYKQNQQTTDK